MQEEGRCGAEEVEVEDETTVAETGLNRTGSMRVERCLQTPVMAACSLAHVSRSKFSGNFGRDFSGLITSLRAGASAGPRWTHDPAACMGLAPSAGREGGWRTSFIIMILICDAPNARGVHGHGPGMPRGITALASCQ